MLFMLSRIHCWEHLNWNLIQLWTQIWPNNNIFQFERWNLKSFIIWGFSSFLSEKTRALSVLCARDLLWSKWIGRNTLKIERENWAKIRQNIQIWRGKTKCYGPLCIQTVFFRNSIIDNIDIREKKLSTVSLFEELKSALARICPKKMD